MGWKFIDDTPQVEAQFHAAMNAVVDVVAAGVVADAQGAAPVLTGALRASGCVVSPLRDTSAEAAAAARAANPQVELDSALRPEDFGDHVASATANFLVEYAEHIEDGSVQPNGVHRAPRPFLGPALRAHADDLDNRAAAALKDMGLKVSKD